jgi:hypothetical protein
MEWVPAVSDEVLRLAAAPLSVIVPNVVVPSLKVIVPVAVPGVTVAVKVNAAPRLEGLRLEVSDTDEATGKAATVAVSGADVLELQPESPL